MIERMDRPDLSALLERADTGAEHADTPELRELWAQLRDAVLWAEYLEQRVIGCRDEYGEPVAQTVAWHRATAMRWLSCMASPHTEDAALYRRQADLLRGVIP